MLEAINFLKLEQGDRLGHGTAMGIDPKLWLARMPEEIVITQGEWFLSLLAAWQLSSENIQTQTSLSHSLTSELAKLSVDIFEEYLDPHLCKQIMDLRELSVEEVRRWQDNDKSTLLSPASNAHYRNESKMVHDAKKNHPKAFDLYWKWQSDRELWRRSNKTISVRSDFLKAKDYLLLQQSLMKKVALKGLIIETLPSSNVRISQYKHFNEHHALRWMKVPPVTPEGDPDILVSLGSDDPGIFSTDIETEFHHLFFAARAYDLSESDALKRVAEVNECGRIYRFHPRGN
jgi:hypothetical protein